MAGLLEAVVSVNSTDGSERDTLSQQVAESVGRGTERVINVACFTSVKAISKTPPAPAAVWVYACGGAALITPELTPELGDKHGIKNTHNGWAVPLCSR